MLSHTRHIRQLAPCSPSTGNEDLLVLILIIGRIFQKDLVVFVKITLVVFAAFMCSFVGLEWIGALTVSDDSGGPSGTSLKSTGRRLSHASSHSGKWGTFGAEGEYRDDDVLGTWGYGTSLQPDTDGSWSHKISSPASMSQKRRRNGVT